MLTKPAPLLKEVGKFLFLIRPRRFGKSSLLTVLECYYDLARTDEFEFLFKGTYVYDHPTAEKNTYMILKFNFSQIDPALDRIEQSFKEHTEDCFFFFDQTYRDYLGDDFFKMLDRKERVHMGN